MNYILVVDDETDIRDIYEMVLRRAFPLDVVTAGSGKQAVEIIKEKGRPEIVISDLNMPDGDGHFLLQSLKENNWDIPFVICSTDSIPVLKKKFPGIYGYIEKPLIIEPVVQIVDTLVTRFKEPPSYIPLRISLLLRWGSANFDLYMKLSETKYVKVINAGEAFIPSDAERFYNKKIQHLHITFSDADQYLKSLEQNLSLTEQSDKPSNDELRDITVESMESVQQIGKSLGWSPVLINAARQSVNLAVKVVSREPNILKLFKQKVSDPESRYAEHVSLLALVSCGFCHQLGWTSDSTQMKLGLAALLHDITIDETIYHDVTLWNQAAADSNDKTPEALKYRNHPVEAASLVHTMKNLPPDVDQIILQHHEMRDGGGFPRGLITSRISPMATVFIIVEDLINFLEDSHNFDEKIQLFRKYREDKYSSGNFKKVFDVFKEAVDKTRQSR